MRYDYRNDYKNMSITDMREALKKLIDRFLNDISGASSDDCIKRMSYLEAKIKAYDKKHYKVAA